ncbi:MAG: hypothetical protein K6C08_06750 [Oscillospiraceae bacterium]|nr:hypothetical protein [Oscillospiraceae bacterium]
MSTIVYQTNPANGAKYAYESISYWDKDKKAPRSKRRYLGRVDPETGEIIKGSRARKGKAAPDTETSEEGILLREELKKKDEQIASLRKELDEMTARYDKTARILKEIRTLTEHLKNN